MKTKKLIIHLIISGFITTLLLSHCGLSYETVNIPIDSVIVLDGDVLFHPRHVINYTDTGYATKHIYVVDYEDSITVWSEGKIVSFGKENYGITRGRISIFKEYLHFDGRDVIIHSTPLTSIEAEKGMPAGLYILLVIILIAGGLAIVLYIIFGGRAFMSGVRIPPRVLISVIVFRVPIPLLVETIMKARKSNVRVTVHDIKELHLAKVDVSLIVDALIKAQNGGLDLSIEQLKEHYLAGGNVSKVVDAMTEAKNADAEMGEDARLNLDFITAKNIDLSGYDVAKSVYDTINYQVLETDGITGVPKDGVQLTMKCKVTLRPILRKIVGSAGAETVLARVDEGVETEIGQTPSHYDVLANPYQIADNVEKKPEITVGTAYQLISIDISDIQVGKDIHAELAIERAHAEKVVAEARRYEAITQEQTMKAKAQEATAKVIEAEVEVQKAMAAAFLDGNLTIKEYHNLQNMMADTNMRKSFSKPPIKDPKNFDQSQHEMHHDEGGHEKQHDDHHDHNEHNNNNNNNNSHNQNDHNNEHKH